MPMELEPSSRNGTTQTIAYTGTSAGATNAFGAETYHIRVASNSACHYKIGSGTQTANATAPNVTAGSNIGNLTGGGGLAAAFDTTTSQLIAACASLAATTSGYVGKSLTTSSMITSAIVFGSSDQGYISGANPTTTIDLYGKQGAAPASGTDGTIIGTITFTDTANESAGRTITSTFSTVWDHVWVNVSTASSSTIDVAELQLFGQVDPFLPANWIEYVRVNPGEKIAAVQAASNGLVTATAGTLWVTELT